MFERQDPMDEDPTCSHGVAVYHTGDCWRCERREGAQEQPEGTPGLEEAVSWVRDGDAVHPTALDLVAKLDRFGYLTPKQEAFLTRLHAEENARRERQLAVALGLAEPDQPCPVGRVVVTGRVTGLKWVDDPYSYRSGAQTPKITVADDRGFRVYGTAAGALLEEVSRLTAEEAHPGGETCSGLRGRRVTFTATLSPSGDDPFFGFFSRPTGARLVE